MRRPNPLGTDATNPRNSSMLDTVRIALGRPSQHQTIHECRRCGTEVGPRTGSCPSCGSADVATYDL